ncbi:heme NO-binding domain-containing protein [Ancylomarina longa]|uniref:Heme NO-binding domain-containing protein n=1 Tax=Ancylomarina longa TaxID=2487017 RepID=A0A434AGX0_9BACT|nr:heme NO-binding domain-containing protein [Ancylomarina longa]RUT73638.1 hypothetical protein DLK05_12485 [Ancylomarina longa]
MNGIFFEEFLEMIESDYGSELVEGIIIDFDGIGIFDSHYDYPYAQFDELMNLVGHVVRRSVSDLKKCFGEYLFSRLVILYRPEFAGNSDIFEFLEHLEKLIHDRIQTYFPSVSIKNFSSQRVSDNTFQVTYQTKSEHIDLAIGLFMGCQKFFNEELLLNTEFLPNKNSIVKFTLSKNQVLI